ncbi:MAG: arylamine N-acetyltransferase [Candidatus Fermentibacteraceae bacterium]|nr:arylamine N-acetyltransferase [Candidatus Fermentibacteraceae bacterium]MBN2607909.1 arylamine N-acetyltransferase [Candidatus Fermentibacteraceae bacterium]
MEQRTASKNAARMFLDHFGLLPGRTDVLSLSRIVDEFSRIPWENLTKFLVKASGIPREGRLRSPDIVIRQHIEDGTGGTCFSLTDTLGAVLSFAGFRCFPVMADMNHGMNIHCALSVFTSDGERYLADPGYLVPLPVRIPRGIAAGTEIHGQRMVWEPSAGDSYDLFTMEDGGRTWRYRVRMAPVDREEFVLHWQNSFEAAGMNSLHANLRLDRQRLSAHNMNLRRTDGVDRSNEKLRDRYPLMMEENFGISRRIAMEAETEWRRSCLVR